MDETLKYYKLKGEGIYANIVIAIKPEQVEDVVRRFGDKGYTLEETERPEGAQIVCAEPHINPAPFVMHNPAAYLYDVYANVKSAKYDGPNCGRCQNRFRYSEFCTYHYQTKSCYRFKLER